MEGDATARQVEKRSKLEALCTILVRYAITRVLPHRHVLICVSAHYVVHVLWVGYGGKG